VVFESPEVADKVVAVKHTIDRREVEAKKAVPKEDTPAPQAAADASQKTRKIFVGGLAPSVDEQVLRQYFEQFGGVEDAVVMYDHDNKRPRGFGFITFAAEESVDKVFAHGAMQNIHDKQIEIKPAVPRDQMPPQARRGPPFYPPGRGGMVGPPGPAGFAPGRVPPPFAFRQPGSLAAAAAAGTYGGPRGGGGPGGVASYLGGGGAMPSPRGLPTSLGPSGYGSPRSAGLAAAAAGYGMAGMGGQLAQYGGQSQQQQQQQQQARFAAAGGMGGAAGGRFGGAGMGQQQFASMYGSLGFGGGGEGGLVQPGTSPGGGMGGGMYSISGLQQLQQQSQAGGLNGYPGQLDMSKLGGLTGGQGAAAAAAAAAMAAKGYGVQAGGLGGGAFPTFAGAQQAFGGQPDAGGYGSSDAAAAAAAAAAGYGADAVGGHHLPGTSPLGTTPEFTSFGAGAGWGS
jgi:hypothetical protein